MCNQTDVTRKHVRNCCNEVCLSSFGIIPKASVSEFRIKELTEGRNPRKSTLKLALHSKQDMML